MKLPGLLWSCEVLDRQRNIVSRSEKLNLTPTQGLDFIQRLIFKSGSVVPTWFIAPFEGDYTPTPTLTAATFPGLATECTAYQGATRKEFVEGEPIAGAVNNADAIAEFEFTAAKDIYGFALLSASAKGSTGGVIVSAARLPSAQFVQIGGVLRVRVTAFTLSAN